MVTLGQYSVVRDTREISKKANQMLEWAFVGVIKKRTTGDEYVVAAQAPFDEYLKSVAKCDVVDTDPVYNRGLNERKYGSFLYGTAAERGGFDIVEEHLVRGKNEVAQKLIDLLAVPGRFPAQRDVYVSAPTVITEVVSCWVGSATMQ